MKCLQLVKLFQKNSKVVHQNVYFFSQKVPVLTDIDKTKSKYTEFSSSNFKEHAKSSYLSTNLLLIYVLDKKDFLLNASHLFDAQIPISIF